MAQRWDMEAAGDILEGWKRPWGSQLAAEIRQGVRYGGIRRHWRRRWIAAWARHLCGSRSWFGVVLRLRNLLAFTTQSSERVRACSAAAVWRVLLPQCGCSGAKATACPTFRAKNTGAARGAGVVKLWARLANHRSVAPWLPLLTVGSSTASTTLSDRVPLPVPCTCEPC